MNPVWFVKASIRIAVAGLLLWGATTAWAGYEDLFKTVRAASWAVYIRSTGGLSAICSAEAYKTTKTETFMITAGHCFTGNDLKKTDFLVTQDHRNFVKAHLVKFGLVPKRQTKQDSSDLDDYTGDDWAVIKIESGERSVMPLGSSQSLSIGEDIIVVGVPFGMDFLAVQGIVGSLDLSLSRLLWNHYYGGNIYIAGGNSGSGVISTKQKAIVGIVNAGPGGQTSLLIFMPIDKLPSDLR